MLEFVTKQTVFDYLSDREDASGEDFSLLTLQRAGVARVAAGFEMSRIGEVAGSGLDLPRIVGDDNECFTVELGEAGEIPGSSAGSAGIGGSDGAVNVLLSCGQFDSVGNDELCRRLERLLPAVAPRGVMVHGMQFYLEDAPGGFWRERLNLLEAFADGVRSEFLVPLRRDQLRFSTSMATLSDAAMYRLYRTSQVMKSLRTTAQGVALVFAYRRIG